MNLFITFLFGLPVLIGVLIVLFTKNSKKITELSISMAFSVLILLVIFDLIPESLEHVNYITLIIFVIIGISLLKILDLFIPDHDHEENKNHISHIGLMATCALFLHNLIEGMALYTSLNNDIHMGVLIGIGIGLHNIPMGMIIASTLKENNSKFKIILISFLTVLATLIGGIITFIFKEMITEHILGILLSLTLGMIIYIVLFELLEHLKHQNKKNNIIGIVIGILIFIISLLFHSH